MEEAVQFAQFDKLVQLLDWERYDEALKETEDYIRDYPDDADGYAFLGKVYLAMDKYERALHWSEEALKADPENRLGWQVKTATLYTQEKWKEALAAIDHGLAIFPEEGYLYLLAGNIHMQKGKFKEASEMFQVLLRLEPEEALYLANYSYLESLLGNPEESLRAEKRALENAPNDAEVFMYVGWAADQRGDHQTALAYMENAVRLDPKSKQYREEYMEILQKQYKAYRFFLGPSRFLSKMKPLYAFLIWVFMWIVFKPLVIVFLILYMAAHWITRMVVNRKVFGKLIVKV